MTLPKAPFPLSPSGQDDKSSRDDARVSTGTDRAAILVANLILVCKFVLKLWLFAVAALFLIAKLACTGTSDER